MIGDEKRRDSGAEPRGERVERRGARRFDFQREQRVGARLAEVDGGHGLAALLRPRAEAIARIHHQRRTDHEHRVGLVERRRRRRHALARHVLAEKHHRRLEHAAASVACGNVEGVFAVEVEMGVAVGGRFRERARERRIARLQLRLDRGARVLRAAGEAMHVADAAVQLDHAMTARALMQAVDVLRDERADAPRRFEPRERAMRAVGLREPDGRPAQHAARPVAAARAVRAEKLLQRDGRRTLPRAVFVAIAGDARIRADARAGQHEQARVALGERLERIERRECISGLDGRGDDRGGGGKIEGFGHDGST
ncbi:hypothetical protein PT2222_100050 [Paraburkholderia tropica]